MIGASAKKKTMPSKRIAELTDALRQALPEYHVCNHIELNRVIFTIAIPEKKWGLCQTGKIDPTIYPPGWTVFFAPDSFIFGPDFFNGEISAHILNHIAGCKDAKDFTYVEIEAFKKSLPLFSENQDDNAIIAKVTKNYCDLSKKTVNERCEVVLCEDCGARLSLSQTAINKEECPICNEISKLTGCSKPATLMFEETADLPKQVYTKDDLLTGLLIAAGVATGVAVLSSVLEKKKQPLQRRLTGKDDVENLVKING